MRSDIEVRQLRAFLAVVTEGTVGKAARALGLAQSTVSESLAALDRVLGAATIRRIRGARSISLTPAGKALLPHARRTIEELDAARASVASASRAARARLEILANESVSTYLLPPALERLRESWPGTRVTVTIATCAAIRSRIAGGRGDLGLMLEADDLLSPGRHSETLQRHTLQVGLALMVIGAASRGLATRERRRPDTRAMDEPSIFVADGAGDFHDLLARYFAKGSSLSGRMEAVGTIEAVRRAVERDSSAIGILPQYAVADDVETGRLRRVNVRPPLPRVKLVAVAATEAPSHPAIAELIESLRRPEG